MEIKKVKYSADKVFIQYEMPPSEQGDPDEYTLKCSDKPLPTFEDSLARLVPAVLEICEMADEEDAHAYSVTGVSFSWAHGIMGATITAKKTLVDSNAPLIINTPHKPAEPYAEGGDDLNCLSTAAAKALEDVLVEAKKYISGDRAQLQLFPENKEAA